MHIKKFFQLRNIPRLKVVYGEKITIQDLMNMECEEIHLWLNKLTLRDINMFIRHWLAGNLPNFRILQLHAFESALPWGEALNGINDKVRNLTRQPRIYK